MSLIQPINIPIGKNKYRLEEDYIYTEELEGVTSTWLKSYRVSRGYIWDGASVPSLFYWFMRRDGLTRAASLIHDRIYSNGHIHVSYRKKPYYAEIFHSRKEADDLFYRILIESNFPKWKAKIAHRCLRIFGGKYWGGGGD